MYQKLFDDLLKLMNHDIKQRGVAQTLPLAKSIEKKRK